LFGNLFPQMLMHPGVAAIDARTHHGNGDPFGLQCAKMGGCVDTFGHAADNAQTGACQRFGKATG